jgi:hypothetical protein
LRRPPDVSSAIGYSGWRYPRTNAIRNAARQPNPSRATKDPQRSRAPATRSTGRPRCGSTRTTRSSRSGHPRSSPRTAARSTTRCSTSSLPAARRRGQPRSPSRSRMHRGRHGRAVVSRSIPRGGPSSLPRSPGAWISAPWGPWRAPAESTRRSSASTPRGIPWGGTLGGAEDDYPVDVAVDVAGDAVVAGWSVPPVAVDGGPGVLQSASYAIFVAKLGW